MPTSFASDALFHWMREKKTYPMQGAFTNPHPFSCNLSEMLGEIKQDLTGNAALDSNGKEQWDTTRPNSDLFIKLDGAGSGTTPSITVDSAVNKFFNDGKGSTHNGNEILMMYEASLAGSTSR